MSRQSPSRNLRSKGIKIKQVLQICLLVAICIWLIYQVKHSHDRKKEFDESDEKVLLSRGGTNDMIKLGRKDIHTQVGEIFSKNAEHDDEMEEGEEEDKNEEDVQGEKSIRGSENEGMGGEEEEIDEHELEKLETQIDREEDFIDNDEEEDNDDQEIEGKYIEDSKTDVYVEDVDRDGDDRSSHEAREENYKADDASSAVTHDTQIDRENSSEQLDLVLGKEKKERNSEETNTSENRKELGVENGEMAKGSNGSDVTVKETLLGNYQNGSFSNNSLTEGSHHRLDVNNSSTEVRLGNRSSSLWNITESFSDNSINGSISTISAETKGMDSKSEEFSSASNSSDSFESVKINASQASMDTGDGKNEIFDSRMPEIFEEVEHDPIDFTDTSNSLEDEDVPANLDTLLHGIWNQGTHAKEAAAE
ncbi:uncharacterized protein [Primulina huaijiensis]|uniref:uncharacterized protein n=1 Tax=Primulina huaijiensis TaxID=1492673 RepID=UPI003CC75D44